MCTASHQPAQSASHPAATAVCIFGFEYREQAYGVLAMWQRDGRTQQKVQPSQIAAAEKNNTGVEKYKFLYALS